MLAGHFLTIATTRPETILGDSAICVNPKDKRFKDLIGKTAIVPIMNREIPIIADKYVDMEYVTRGLKEREKQKPERDALTLAINNASDKIAELSDKKGTLQLEQDKIEAEVGPIKYIAELIYGDEAKDHFDKAVRWVIIVLIFVFDPLAVLLLIAANISLRTRKEGQEEIKNTKKVNLTKELQKEKAKSAKLRKKERDYKGFVRKLGAKELSDLDPDEIRLKLDQIMDWNEKSKQP